MRSTKLTETALGLIMALALLSGCKVQSSSKSSEQKTDSTVVSEKENTALRDSLAKAVNYSKSLETSVKYWQSQYQKRRKVDTVFIEPESNSSSEGLFNDRDSVATLVMENEKAKAVAVFNFNSGKYSFDLKIKQSTKKIIVDEFESINQSNLDSLSKSKEQIDSLLNQLKINEQQRQKDSSAYSELVKQANSKTSIRFGVNALLFIVIGVIIGWILRGYWPSAKERLFGIKKSQA